MESYASHFKIKPIFNQTVQTAEFDESCGLWRFWTRKRLECSSRWLLVATGENAKPAKPDVAGLERFQGRVVHTSGYKSGSEFTGQRVLVVGCGNSGMEASLDLCSPNVTPHFVARNTVHVLPNEMVGISTFGVAMAQLKWFPLKLVDKILLLIASISLDNTDQLGLRWPKTGPLELKNVTGKTPVLDVGAFSHIKSGVMKKVVPRSLTSILGLVLVAPLLLRPCNAAVGIAASYDPPYAPTACFGYDPLQFPPNFQFAAAGEEIWDNGAACGRQYWVQCVSGDRPKICNLNLPVQVKIVDRALTAVSRSSLIGATISLSKTTFKAITNSPTPSVNIDFQQV